MSNHGGEKRPRLTMDRSYPPIPDYQSEAQPLNDTKFRRNEDDPEKSVDQVHSEYSVGASNGRSCDSLETRNEDSEATSSPMSDDDEDEEEEEIKPVSPAKRRRINSEMHNLSERRRRERINEKMRALRALIPNSDKVDKVSMLDKAIEYLKSLQLQLQFQLMVTMGSRLCLAPNPMMLGMQQMQAANVIMGTRMPTGVGFCQFPNPNLLGFYAGGMLPLPPTSQPPFIPLVGGSSALPMPCNSSSGSLPVPDLMYINNNHNVN